MDCKALSASALLALTIAASMGLTSPSERFSRFSRIFFFFNDTATTEIYTLSLHDALPICIAITLGCWRSVAVFVARAERVHGRSEEHTSELQSPCNFVCRLLLEKKKRIIEQAIPISRRGLGQLHLHETKILSKLLQRHTRY